MMNKDQAQSFLVGWVTQGTQNSSCAGCILFLANSIQMKAGLWTGSNNSAENNYAELMALKFKTTKICCEKQVKQIQVCGDSNLVIKWMKGTEQLLNIHLRNPGVQIKDIAGLFESISFTCIEKKIW